MGPHSHDGSTLTWRRVNTLRWETEQRCDGAPCFSHPGACTGGCTGVSRW